MGDFFFLNVVYLAIIHVIILPWTLSTPLPIPILSPKNSTPQISTLGSRVLLGTVDLQGLGRGHC